MSQNNAGHLHGAAQRLENFFSDLSGIAGRLKAGVEALTNTHPSPPPEAEDLSAQFGELDAALDQLAGIPDLLHGVADRLAAGGRDASGVTPLPGDASAMMGTGPEGGSTGTVGSVAPITPLSGAPGAAVTPTGSHDMGPGGGGPEYAAGEAPGFPTTESGRPPGQEPPAEASSAPASSTDSGGAASSPTPGEPKTGLMGTTPREAFPAGQASGQNPATTGLVGESVPTPIAGTGPQPESATSEGKDGTDGVVTSDGGGQRGTEG